MTRVASKIHAGEVQLYRRTGRSTLADLCLAYHRRRVWWQAALHIWLYLQLLAVGYQTLPQSGMVIAGVAWVIIAGLITFDRLSWSRRPASLAYLEAAMRCVSPTVRLELLVV